MGSSDAKLAVIAPGHDRKRFLGGSDVAAVMQLGATYWQDGKRVQQTPYTVWQRKIGEDPGIMDPDAGLFLERRRRYEGPIVQHLKEEFQAKIVAMNRRYQDPEHDFLAAEIDFEWEDPSDGSIQNGEIKTVHPFAFQVKDEGRRIWGEEGTDQVPVWYYSQAMHGLGVTGRKVCILVALVGFDQMVFYRIERDDEVIADMRAECARFWQEHVLAKVPPPPQTLEDTRRIMQRLRGRPAELTMEMHDNLMLLEEARNELRVTEEAVEDLSFKIGDFVCRAWQHPNPYVPPAVKREAKAKKQPVPDPAADPMEDATLWYDGKPVATWKKQSGAFLDQRALKVAHPDVVANFTKRTHFRVLRMVKP